LLEISLKLAQPVIYAILTVGALTWYLLRRIFEERARRLKLDSQQ